MVAVVISALSKWNDPLLRTHAYPVLPAKVAISPTNRPYHSLGKCTSLPQANAPAPSDQPTLEAAQPWPMLWIFSLLSTPQQHRTHQLWKWPWLRAFRMKSGYGLQVVLCQGLYLFQVRKNPEVEDGFSFLEAPYTKDDSCVPNKNRSM